MRQIGPPQPPTRCRGVRRSNHAQVEDPTVRKNGLRNNYLGLVGYTMVLLGILSGGVWLVVLATVNAASALVPGILALALLAWGGAMLLIMALRGRQDPLEPAAVDVHPVMDEGDGDGRGQQQD